MSELAKQLIEKEIQERTGRLELGRCGLTDLEAQAPELFELTWLEELILSNGWLDRGKQKWVKSQNRGAYNCLFTLPPSLSRLSGLKTLMAGGDSNLGWHISDIRILEKLPHLNTLDLRNNQINDIRFLEKLTQLNTLDLSSNQISDIRVLEKLTNLNILDLSSNQISDIRILEKLPNLNILDLGINQISDICFLEKLTNLNTLDLDYNQISDIRFLEKLTNLNTLRLGSNQISDIRFLEKLINVNTLDLGYNQISDIRFLENLPNLTSLNLSSNQITDYRFLEKLTNLNTLNLGQNQISDISFLENLPNLTSLNLRSSQIIDYRFLEKLPKLTSLDICDNRINDIRFLEKLPNLTSLDLSSSQIIDYRFLEKLPNLTSLYLRNNRIRDIRFLEKLTTLTSLHLSHNQISNIRFLENLTNLTFLELGDNQISDVRFLGSLTHLTLLDLSHNQISDIRFLGSLTHLTFLDLSKNQISDIRFLEKLTSLDTLNLASNQIRDIGFLEKLPNLTVVTLNYNQISGVRFLEKLTSLDTLKLASNQIRDIDFLEKLPNLTSLDLDDNQISNIKMVKKLPRLNRLSLAGNRVRDIPWSLLMESNCLKNVKAWLTETADPTQTQPNRNVKLMLTGNGNAGKSTLFHALQHGKCEKKMDSTHGILLGTWSYAGEPPVEFIIWDFGGQEIYHGTHRLFMASEAIQLILTDPVTEKAAKENAITPDRLTGEDTHEQPLLYWIDTTQQLSPHSIMMVVQNKKDEMPERYQPAYETAAKKNIDYYHVSARRGDAIPLLRAAIHDNAQQLIDYGMPMPRSWIAARNWFLQNLQKPAAERERLISKAEFFRRCREDFGVIEMAIPALLTLLHHNGILYFNEQYLHDTIIADQRWALDAIYKPLERGSEFYDYMRNDTFGKTRLKHLFRAFGADYSDSDKWLFLHFMRSCGLCFRVKEIQTEKETEGSYYVFPEFLYEKMSESARLIWDGKPRRLQYFRRRYEYLNYYRIQAFIAALGQKTRMDFIWRNGILIQTTEGDFLVKTDKRQNAVVIAIEENALTKWLPEILKIWEQGELEIKATGWESSENGMDFQPFDVQALRNQLAYHAGLGGRSGREAGEIPVIEQLPDIPQIRPLRLVASYAREDRWAVEALKKQLSGLRQEGKIDFWWDQKLDGREFWNQETQERFEEADGYIVFVSPFYVDDEVKTYIHQHEIPVMMRRKKEAKIPIYCLTVTKVDYGPVLGQFDYFSDKKAIPEGESEQAEFLFAFVEEVVKGRFLKKK